MNAMQQLNFQKIQIVVRNCEHYSGILLYEFGSKISKTPNQEQNDLKVGNGINKDPTIFT